VRTAGLTNGGWRVPATSLPVRSQRSVSGGRLVIPESVHVPALNAAEDQAVDAQARDRVARLDDERGGLPVAICQHQHPRVPAEIRLNHRQSTTDLDLEMPTR
jgi:hypothetical protein